MPVTRKSLLLKVRDRTNNEGWQEFYRIYSPFITSHCRRYGVTEASIDDVVQDVWLQLLRTMERFEMDPSRGHFRSWLRKVVLNKIRDRWRRQKRHPDAATLNDALSTPDATSTRLELAESEVQISSAVRFVQLRSNEITWKCFAEHRIAGRTAESVARDLNISVDAVYTNCSRIAFRIQQRLNELKSEAGHDAN